MNSGTSQGDIPRFRREGLVAAGLLALAVMLAYANAWSVPFLFDDYATLRDNPALRAGWQPWAWVQPPAHTGVGGRPLAHLTLVLNHALTGDAVAGYHAGNLLLHLGAGWLFFGLVRRTLLLPILADHWKGRAGGWALAVAAVWLLHPVQTASVTYLSQRTEVLMGLCYFGTLYGLVRGAAGSGRTGWLVFSVGCCVAGMASKEVMVTAPVVALFYDRAFLAGSFREAWRRRGRWYLGLASTWLLLLLLLPGLGGRGVGFGRGMEWWEYSLREGRAIALYLARTVWPQPLVFDYGVDFPVIGAPEWLGVGVVLLLGAAAVVGSWRRPTIGFLPLWFLVTLAPTSSVVPIPLQPIAENRAYLPLAAVAAALMLGAGAWAPRVGRMLGVLLTGALIVLSLARNHTYRSDVAIWHDTVLKVPGNARAHHNLGNALREAGRLEEAERAFLAALALRPDYAEAVAALGGVLGRMGRVDDALRQSRRALELDAQLP
ncbi:MAG: tetratricopeptide repeat protein, partial [Verrucomicrobia bacterium]|nr:tetratricopeptide repeat protein [Verrucomicrobiota bacterium]